MRPPDRAVQGEQRPGHDVAAGVFLLVAAAAYVYSAARVESYGSDTSMYFGLAQSLVHGEGYRFNFVPHTVYPPGFPLFLAGLMAVVGESFATLMRVNVPVLFVGLACIYGLIRSERGTGTSLAVLVLCGTSFRAFFLTTAGLHSDILYFTVAALALWSVDYVERARPGPLRTAILVLGTASVAYLPLVRSIGVTLLAGLCLWMLVPVLLRRDTGPSDVRGRLRRWTPAAVATLVVLGAWMGWSAQQEAYEGDGHMASYTQQLLKADPHELDSPTLSPLRLPGRAVELLALRVQRSTAMLLNQPYRSFSWGNPAALLFLLGVAGTVGVGLVRSMMIRATLSDCYVLAYGGLLLLWPFDEGQRFLFPILPFLLLYAVEGVDWIGAVVTTRGPLRPWGPRLLAAGKGALFMAVVVMGILPSIEFARRTRGSTPAMTSNAPTLAVMQWVEQNTEPDDVIMADEFAIMHRLTGRRTYRFPLLTDPARIEAIIARTSADYIVVLREDGPAYFRPGTESRFESVRMRAPERFRLVHDYGEGMVYEVVG